VTELAYYFSLPDVGALLSAAVACLEPGGELVLCHYQGGFDDRLREHFARHYQNRDGHRHIHGANLGVSANAYLATGDSPLSVVTRMCCLCEHWKTSARMSPGVRCRASPSARALTRGREAASGIPCWR